MESLIEVHPLPPFAPEGAKMLMLGSFPPPRARWKMDFFYPNFQNDMWRIFGVVFFKDKHYFLTDDQKSFHEAKIRTFLTEKGIALWDTAMEVNRQKGNASDKYLEVLRPIDLKQILSELPDCRTIVATGQKALDTLLMLTGAEEPKVGSSTETVFCSRHLRIYRMPSSSRAYPKPLEEKAVVYKKMFEEIGITI
ncbi:uracil-DNA glycosylase family protein [Tannerella sp.]|uniref:uracil-DNA glycosylase family protein n=1 Tax=Tannerella sp. TaxID=2382127 RepID=UPI0026DB0045|nr:uracil-DNA glycosylase family protein [Tannerella sp.]MDO4702601.1 uracil-DNA glycosylase family protein [Tannerella sp.]